MPILLEDFLVYYPNNGIPLRMYMEMPAGRFTLKTSKEAVEIIKGAIPAAVFALPVDYAWKDEGKEQLEQIKAVKADTLPQRERP